MQKYKLQTSNNTIEQFPEIQVTVIQKYYYRYTEIQVTEIQKKKQMTGI